MTDVREMEATYDYIKLAEERRMCNETQYEECAAAEYIERGIQQCNCTPYHLRNFRKLQWGTIENKVGNLKLC